MVARLIFSTLVSVFLAATVAQAHDCPKFSDILTRKKPAYPLNLKLQRQEGSVIIRANFSEAGSVQQAEVVESTNDGFNESALEWFKASQFQPILQDGKGIAVTHCPYRVTFSFPDSRGNVVSSAKFLSLAKKTAAALDNRNLPIARDYLSELYQLAETLNDIAIVYSLDADWMLASNRPWDAVRLYGTQSKELDPEFHGKELRRKFLLQTQMGLYGDAVGTATEIAEANPKAPLAPEVAKAVADMEALAKSDQSMSIELSLDGTCYWKHECAAGQGYAAFTPLRRKVKVLAGADFLVKAEARCRYVRLALDPKSDWILDPNLGSCTLHLVAPKGSVVTLAEFHPTP